MKLQTITFMCRTQTPLVMGNATSGDVEIRTPAIKGLLRFWWRAINGHLDLKSLKAKETKIFGSGAENGGRSSFDIMIDATINDNNIGDRPIFKEHNIEEYDTRNNWGQDRGLAYLLYPFIFGENAKRQWIVTDTAFSVIFSSYSTAILEEVTKVFIVSSVCGAIGSRARRGLGNFKIINSDRYELESIEELKNFLSSALSPQNHQVSVGMQRNWSNLHQAKVLLGYPDSGGNSWINALDCIGYEFCNYRFKVKTEKSKTPIFGLPLHHAYEPNQKDIIRRSSPLIIKTIEINGQFYWMLIWLQGVFLPKGVHLTNGHGSRVAPSWELLDDFWSEMSKLKNTTTFTINPAHITNE